MPQTDEQRRVNAGHILINIRLLNLLFLKHAGRTGGVHWNAPPASVKTSESYIPS